MSPTSVINPGTHWAPFAPTENLPAEPLFPCLGCSSLPFSFPRFIALSCLPSSMTKNLGKYFSLTFGQNLPFQFIPTVSHPFVMKHCEHCLMTSSQVLEVCYQVLIETSSSPGQINPVPMASPHVVSMKRSHATNTRLFCWPSTGLVLVDHCPSTGGPKALCSIPSVEYE